ncbi:unnamed protein product, partial [Protopolystoma xenopodis]
LRHLSQECLDQYTAEAASLGQRVEENRRHLRETVEQRRKMELLLLEARTDAAAAVASTTQYDVTVNEADASMDLAPSASGAESASNLSLVVFSENSAANITETNPGRFLHGHQK